MDLAAGGGGPLPALEEEAAVRDLPAALTAAFEPRCAPGQETTGAWRRSRAVARAGLVRAIVVRRRAALVGLGRELLAAAAAEAEGRGTRLDLDLRGLEADLCLLGGDAEGAARRHEALGPRHGQSSDVTLARLRLAEARGDLPALEQAFAQADRQRLVPPEERARIVALLKGR